MGAAAAAVGDVFSGAVEAIFEPIKQVGNIVESAVREVGHAVESVGREVGKIGQAAVNDPVGTIAKVAAIASGQWWALPLVSAGLVIANGGDIGQAALAAGISLAAQGVAYGVGEALGSAGSGVSDMMAQDAASMSAQGLSSAQIADTLAQSYGVAADIASTTADLASMGMTASQIAADLGSTYGADFAAEAITPSMQNALANIAANTGGSGVRAALSGGDLNDVLTAMGTAGVGTAVGAGTSTGLQGAGLNSGVSGTIGAATGAAAGATVAGKDSTSAFLNSLINTTLREGGAQAKSLLKNAWDKVSTSVSDYNSQLEKTNANQTTLAPLEKEAKEAEAAVNAELTAYQPVRDKFSDLVKQYDAAKAAGNVELANSLADQANAMIPELNAATNKYNDVYNNYASKLSTYSAGVEAYKADIAKTDELKANYEKETVALGDETKKLSEAAAKVVNLAEPVQNGFAKMYQNGTSVEDALANADKLNGMSTVAQETFNRNIDQNGDVTKSLEFANTINSLDTKQQSSFQLGITKGLDDSTALDVAPVISNYDVTRQNAYTDSIKGGYGKEGADLIAAFAGLGGSPTTAEPTVPTAPKKLDVASEFMKLNPEERLKYKELVNDTTRPMTAEDALKAASDFFISPAAAGTVPYVGKTPEGKDLLESVYRQDANGRWSEYIPDGKGGYTNTGAVLVGDYSAGPSGNKYVVDEKATENGVPSLSLTPYTGPLKETTPSTGPATMTPAEEAEYEKELADQIAKDKAADDLLKQKEALAATPSTPNTSNAGTGTTLPTADFTSPATKAPSTGSTSTGTATNTTGAKGTTGTTGGAGSGTPVTGGAGTGSGTGLGKTDGTGTGTGGTGTGFGIGTGTGAGGVGYAGYQALQTQDQYGGIKNLTPGLTERMDYTLSGLPVDSEQDIPNPTTQIPQFAPGGSTTSAYDPFSAGSSGDSVSAGLYKSLTPGLTKAQINYILTGMPGHAEGGAIEEHNPQFFSEGGLGSIENRYVQGEGDGTSDSVPAMLANGEFVIPADVVAKIGNGSNEAGAGVLDQFLVEIRKHAHSNGDKLPPESKGPLGYLLDAKRKVKA